MQTSQQTAKQTAQSMYEQGATYKDIATKVDISVNTLKSWIRRGDWTRKNGAKNANKNAPKRKKGANKKLSNKKPTDERWKMFCELYLRNLNATQAYMDVYKVKYKTAMVSGSRLLRNVKVQEYLHQLKEEHQDQLFIDTHDLLLEEAKIAKADLSKVLNTTTIEQERIDMDGEPVTDIHGQPIIDRYNEFYLKESDEIDWSVISEAHRGKDGLVVKLHDKQKAIDTLFKQLPNPKDELQLEKMKLENKRLELIISSLDTDKDQQMNAIDKLLDKLDNSDDYSNETVK